MFAVIGVQLFKVGNYITSHVHQSCVRDPMKIWSEFPNLSLELSLTCHTTDCGEGTRLARFVELSSIYSCIMLTHKQARSSVFPPPTLSIPNFNVFLLHWTQTQTHKHIMYTSTHATMKTNSRSIYSRALQWHQPPYFTILYDSGTVHRRRHAAWFTFNKASRRRKAFKSTLD